MVMANLGSKFRERIALGGGFLIHVFLMISSLLFVNVQM